MNQKLMSIVLALTAAFLMADGSPVSEQNNIVAHTTTTSPDSNDRQEKNKVLLQEQSAAAPAALSLMELHVFGSPIESKLRDGDNVADASVHQRSKREWWSNTRPTRHATAARDNTRVVTPHPRPRGPIRRGG
jgi:hypothetical protein